LPLHEVRYLECKLILRPNHFTSRSSLFDFTKVMRRPAEKNEVDVSTQEFVDAPLQIREVLFVDTADFRLYNNAFILRRRIPYKEGFPSGDAEIVFKFRHSDMQKAAQTDVRPQIFGDYEIKFKAEALPLKDQLGGVRLLFSHNVQFPLGNMHEVDPGSMDNLERIFPALRVLKKSPNERVEPVSEANVALWRARGDHRPLIGEFAYQIRFKRRQDLREKAMRRAEAFFVDLQYAAKDWIALGATKTGVVYHLKGNPPHAHE
jgi:hypothetical protein